MNRNRTALLAGLLICIGSTLAVAQPAPIPTYWSGTFTPPPGAKAPRASVLEVKIFSLTTDKEVATLAAALHEGGPLGLREAMGRFENRGWVKINGLGGATVAVLRVLDLPNGGRRLRVFCALPIRVFDKPTAAPDTQEYPFSFIELDVDKSGRGEGKLISAAKFEVTDQGLELGTAGAPIVKVLDVIANNNAR
jgi:hypothetical protein